MTTISDLLLHEPATAPNSYLPKPGGTQQESATMDATATTGTSKHMLWQQLIENWLDLKANRSGSTSTRRNYQMAMAQWIAFLSTQLVTDPDGTIRPVELWEADPSHVRGWQAVLQTRVAGVTVNHRLSCISSFYAFVIKEKRTINGIEINLFEDRLGRPRMNPFRTENLHRAKIEQYQKARPLTLAEYNQFISYLESRQNRSVADARNYALILTYLYTGWRSAELLRMRWKDIRPSRSQPGCYIYAWRGKGGKHKDDVLPAECVQAIVHYLKMAHRWELHSGAHRGGLAPEEYVWSPARKTEMHGMKNRPTVDLKAPISDKSALRILRTALRKAGIEDPDSFRLYDLRHTHARLLLESGYTEEQVKERLNYSSLSATTLYTKKIRRSDPVDAHSSVFRQLRVKG